MIKKIIKENWGYIFSIVLFIIFVLIIKNFSIYKFILDLDYSLIEILSKVVTKPLTTIFLFITYLGDWFLPTFIIVLLLIFYRNKYYGIILAINYLFSGLFAFVTKIIVSRPRPVYSLIEHPDSYSFPSGHTLTSLVFFIMFFYLISRKVKNKIISILIGLSFSILILLIAFSRLYLGVHYLSDVIGGIILGILLVLLNINIVEKNFKQKLK